MGVVWCCSIRHLSPEPGIFGYRAREAVTTGRAHRNLLSSNHSQTAEVSAVRSAFQTSNQAGTFKCARARCKTCPFICNVEKLSGPKRSIKITDHFTCTSTNVIYCITCTLCKKLYMWSQRDLSIVGRINIIKTLALSKLVFVCSVMSTPKDFSKEVNRITFDFIWNHKPAKIKKTTLLRQKTAGDLDMRDFSLFDKALKLNWVKWLCSNSDAPWQYIPKSLPANVGSTEL